ncbi:hypothetical protein [Rhodococcus koreensis]|uniref:hypothetical protein n=1 Tax=Rhodococcus koreensis TaxID=99653 RepID=UPI00198195C9|nr:hypothetical protein [Rhodococcus koreensis]QSE86355.1 hypothetical protein JWS14_45990 [Rhodococcus koreensis]
MGEHATLVVIEGVGSYGAGLAERVLGSGLAVVEPAAMPAAHRRGIGKTDSLDAVRIARSVLAVDISRLRCRAPRVPAPLFGSWSWPENKWPASGPEQSMRSPSRSGSPTSVSMRAKL